MELFAFQEEDSVKGDGAQLWKVLPPVNLRQITPYRPGIQSSNQGDGYVASQERPQHRDGFRRQLALIVCQGAINICSDET